MLQTAILPLLECVYGAQTQKRIQLSQGNKRILFYGISRNDLLLNFHRFNKLFVVYNLSEFSLE